MQAVNETTQRFQETENELQHICTEKQALPEAVKMKQEKAWEAKAKAGGPISILELQEWAWPFCR